MLARPAIALVLILTASPYAFAQTADIGRNFLGNTAAESGVSPPDTIGAIGPNHFVQYTNGAVGIYRKDGNRINLIGEDAFWQSVSGNGFATINAFGDPRIVYDSISQRWYISCFTAGTNNQLLLARSNTADPTGGWAGLIINATAGPTLGLFADYPTLGVDANGVYLSANNYAGVNVQSTSLFAIPKADMLLPTPSAANLNRFDGMSSTRGFAIYGTTNTSTSAASSGIIGVDFSFFGRAAYTPITWGGTNNTQATLGNTTSIVANPAANYPTAAPQPATAVLLSGGDDRMIGFAHRVGNLVYVASGTTFNPGSGPLSAAMWSVINANANPQTLVQNGIIHDASGGNRFFLHPSIAANTRGDVVMAFTASNSNLAPSVWAVVGSPNTPNNPTAWTFGTPFQVQLGNGSFSDGGNPSRWGDYSAVTVDPADPGAFWITVTRTQGGGIGMNWGAHVAELTPRVANDIRWAATPTTSTTFTFATVANWNPDTSGVPAVPGASSHAIYSRWLPAGVTATINLPAATTANNRFSIRQTGPGGLTLGIPTGATWNLTNTGDGAVVGGFTNPASLAVAEFQGNANVTITSGGTLSTRHTLIGAQAGGTGTLTLTGAGTTWNNLNHVHLGGTATAPGGTGRIIIAGGATANVSDTIRLWTTASGVNVGSGGTAGTLTVNRLANAAGTNPTITAAHPGSLLRITNTATPAYTGTITVGSGARFDGTGGVAGPVALTDGGIIRGGTGTATPTDRLTLAAGLTLAGTNFFHTAVADTNVGNAQANPAASRIVLNTAALATGGGTPLTRIVLFGDLAQLDAGQSYTVVIATYGSTSGLLESNFSIDPPVGFIFLGTPDLDLLSNQLVVHFVPAPEPTTTLALALASLGLGYATRRKIWQPKKCL